MKKFLLLFALLTCCINSFSQSEESLRDYFERNASTLDPIEGIYDVESYGDYITPFVHQKYPKSNSTFYIMKDGNKYKVYVKAGDTFGESGIKIEPIAGNAYRFYFETSYTRIYLENRNHFEANIELDNESGKAFTGNDRLARSVRIILKNDAIKTFPNN